MEAKYNVIVVGKTGTGKSALINYLYGVKTREIGAGKPVTGKGFHPVDCEINGFPVRLFDSWGLEVGKDQEWIKLLNEELKKHDTGKPAEDWFHSVFYCIGAGGHRIESLDSQIIRRFIEEKYKVAVILTKADIITEDQEKELKDSIINDVGEAVPIIPVCSLEQKFRDGRITKEFGKKEVELQAYNDFWDSIILRLPEHCVKVLEQRIDEWYEKQKKYIEENTGLSNLTEISTNIGREYNLFIKEEVMDGNTIKKKLQHTLELYGNFAQSLKYPPPETNRIMSFPTKQSIKSDDSEWKWWDIFWVLPALPFVLIAYPFLLIDHLIFGAGNNKKQLTEWAMNLVSQLKQKLPEIESKIKKALENLKEDRTV